MTNMIKMDLQTDLERVLWHELGHLCVDLIQCEEYNDYSVDFMFVIYTQEAIGDIKWSGGVRISPPTRFEEMIKDTKLTSYAILGNISGCIFETIFRKIIGDKAAFEDCFGINNSCPGRGDFINFFELNSQYRRLYGNDDSRRGFIEKELNVLYFDKLWNDCSFIKDMKDLVDEIKIKVLMDYEQSNDKKNYSYQFIGKELDTIKEAVILLLKESTYGKNIRAIISEIFERIKTQ